MIEPVVDNEITHGIIDDHNLLDLPSILEQICLDSEQIFRAVTESLERERASQKEIEDLAQSSSLEDLKQALEAAEDKAETAVEDARVAVLEAKAFKDAAQQTEVNNERLRTQVADLEVQVNTSQELCEQLSQEIGTLKSELERWQHRST